MPYERTLVQIRERSFLDLLDLALVIVRRHSRVLVPVALAGIAPWAVLNFWLLAEFELPSILWGAVLLLEAPFATAPLTLVLGGLMFGRPPRTGSVIRQFVVSVPSLLLTQVFIRGFMAGTLILIPLIPALFWFQNEVILLEKGRGIGAIRRCHQLCHMRSSELFMQWLGQIFFGISFVLCFWIGTGAVLSAILTSEITWDRPGLGDLSGLRFQLGVWIAIAFFGVARFLTYIDQRIRLEGWELRLRLESVGRELEGGRR